LFSCPRRSNRSVAGTVKGEFDRKNHKIKLDILMQAGGHKNSVYDLMEIDSYRKAVELGEVPGVE